ncbi:MAG: hypothetical protein ACK56W_05135 [Pirellula sp.]
MRVFLSSFIVAALLFNSGCDSKPAGRTGDSKAAHDHSHDGHDHGHDHDHKETAASPADALKSTLEKAIAATQKIFAAGVGGKVEDAHDELHDIGHFLESLPELAKKAALDTSSQEVMNKAAKSLFEVMGKIDELLHDGKEVKFDEFKSDMDAGLSELKKIAKP